MTFTEGDHSGIRSHGEDKSQAQPNEGNEAESPVEATSGSISVEEQKRIVSVYVNKGDELIAICLDPKSTEEQILNATLAIREGLGKYLFDFDFAMENYADYQLIERIFNYIKTGR